MGRWQQVRRATARSSSSYGEARHRQVAHHPGDLRERIAGEPPRTGLRFHALPYYTSTAFYPFVEQLKFSLGLDREDASALSTGEPGECDCRRPAAETRAGGAVVCRAAVDPDRRALSAARPIAAAAEGRDRRSPGQSFPGPRARHAAGDRFEDLHWIDPTSREVVDVLVDRVQNRSILAIITARSEFQPSWNAHSHIHHAVLNRLSRPVARDAGRAGRRARAAQGGHRGDHRQDRRRAVVPGGADQDGARIQPPDRAAWALRAVGPVAATGDPGDADGLADGAARPDGAVQADRADRRHDRSRVLLRDAVMRSPTRRRSRSRRR